MATPRPALELLPEPTHEETPFERLDRLADELRELLVEGQRRPNLVVIAGGSDEDA